MNGHFRIWVLFGKKMASEISKEELLELQELLKENPEVYYAMEVLSDLWNSKKSEDRHESANAFYRHEQRFTKQ